MWAAIPKAIASLEWTVEETDEAAHRAKAKTKTAFLSYSSVLSIEARAVAENTTRVNVTAETPVTTITGIMDFGRTRERIDSFLMALMQQLNVKKTNSEKAE